MRLTPNIGRIVIDRSSYGEFDSARARRRDPAPTAAAREAFEQRYPHIKVGAV
jgi:hypothetical protein